VPDRMGLSKNERVIPAGSMSFREPGQGPALPPICEDGPDVPMLLGDLYGVLHPDVDWASRLQKLALAFDCDLALLLTVDEASAQLQRVEVYGLCDAVLQDYRRHYMARDPLLACALAAPGAACSDDLECPQDDSDFSLWLKLATGQRYRAAVLVTRDPAEAVCLMLMRSSGRGPLPPQCLESLADLAPHLVRVVTLHENIEAVESRWRTWHAIAAQSSQAFMLVDGMGVVHDTNAAADGLLADGDGLGLDKGRLMARMPADKNGLAEALQRATDADEPIALAIHRISGQSPYHVVLRPIGRMGAPHDTGAAIGVCVSDPQRPCGVSPEQFKQLCGLSRREAELTALLLDGASLAEAAKRMSTTEATARTSLNRIYDKLGVRRQSDLMRLFWGSALGDVAGSD
jgi:DNA-binding CsgD family transcriptional regulator